MVDGDESVGSMTAGDDAPLVLVVDDDQGARELLVTSLQRAGMAVVASPSAEEAFEIVDARPFSVIVADVGMPGMSGIDFVRTLRSRPGSALIPVILVTGSGDSQSVIEGLDAGADDFLSKPVRLDELIARVRALIRVRHAWAATLQAELRVRSDVVAALGTIDFGPDSDESAERVVREISTRYDAAFISIDRVSADGWMGQLATFNRHDGVRRGGVVFDAGLAGYLMGRARDGPWIDDVTVHATVDRSPSFRTAGLDAVASAPIYIDETLVALLSIGSSFTDPGSPANRRAKLLSAVVDYGSVLEAVAERLATDQGSAEVTRERLQQALDAREFHIVLQPIVDLESLDVFGFEALTRFTDGTPPDVRFEQAAAVDVGGAYELVTMAAAVEEGRRLPIGAVLALNVSPITVMQQVEAIRTIVADAGREIVLEITEHAPIADYPALMAALAGVGDHVRLAVDDAGAGFASLRHILELQPTFAKLDISLVRGIDTDKMRQALAAGLNYYGLRTGCRLIAEGVETQAEADTLVELGIEFGQGYLFGRPARLHELASA